MSRTAKPFIHDATTRLFPLPNVVLFPHGMLPLHIFEPRYRQMTEDALAGDRLITMVLAKPVEAGGLEPIHSVGCQGSIVHDERLPDGRFMIVVRGEQRVRLLEELPTDRLYRVARIAPLADQLVPAWSSRRQLQRAEILRFMRCMVPVENELMQAFLQLLATRCTSAAFADMVAFASPLPTGIKQELLGAESVDRRLELLADFLGTTAESRRAIVTFPPSSSLN